MRLALPMHRLALFLSTISFLAAALHAAPSPSSVRHPSMGVQTHFGHGGTVTTDSPRHRSWDIQKSIQAASALGVGWIRDEIFWNQYETEKGRYQLPPRALEWIGAANAAGLKVLLIFNADRNNVQKLYSDPYNPDAYARAAANLARELRGEIHALEIINEPHNFGYNRHYGGTWNGYEPQTGQDSPWIGAYVKLINTAASAIRRANPDVKIIGLGSPAPANFRKIAQGLASEIDGITDHPYSFRTIPELVPFVDHPAYAKRDGILTADAQGSFASQVRLYREHSARHNGPKEIWFTEWGFPNYQEYPPKQYAGYSLEAQAKYAQRRYAECLGLGVEMSIWYDLKDDGVDPYDPESNFGLMTFDFAPKPVYAAVQRLASFMIDWRASISLPPDAIRITWHDKRPDVTPLTWDGGRLVAPDAAKTYAFDPVSVKPEGKSSVMILHWSAERAGGDLQARIGDMEINWPVDRPLPTRARFHDLWSGRTRDAKISPHPENPRVLRFVRIAVPDAPVALILD